MRVANNMSSYTLTTDEKNIFSVLNEHYPKYLTVDDIVRLCKVIDSNMIHIILSRLYIDELLECVNETVKLSKRKYKLSNYGRDVYLEFDEGDCINDNHIIASRIK